MRVSMKSLLGAAALLSLITVGRASFAAEDAVLENANDVAATTEVATAQPAANDTVLMINADTKQVIRVDADGNVTPVSADELKQIDAQASAQQSLDNQELWGRWGGWHHGWGGGWHHHGWGGWGGWHHHHGFWGGGGFWHRHFWHRHHGYWGGRWGYYHRGW